MVARAWTVTRHLAVLSLVLTLPMLLFIAVLGSEYVRSERQRMEAQVVDAARQAAALLDRELSGMIASLEVLATSLALQQDDFETFYQQALRVREAVGFNIVMRDQEGQQRVNTRLPWGAPLDREPSPADQGVRQARGPHVSNLIWGTAANRWVILISVPVRRNNDIVYFLSMSVEPEHFRDLIAPLSVPPERRVTLVGGDGKIIARWRKHDAFVGKPVPDDALQFFRQNPSGLWQGKNLEGQDVRITHARLALADWLVVAGVEGRAFNAPLRQAVLFFAPLSVALLGAAGVGTYLVGGRLAGSMGALTKAASAVGHGEIAPPVRTGVSEVNQVGEILSASSLALKERERELRATLAELTGLLENAPIGIALLDRDLRFVRINGFLAALNGPPVAEHIGRYAFDVVPDLRDPLEPIFRRVLDEGKALTNLEVEGATPRDPERKLTWRAHYYPLRDGAGAVVGLGIIAEDITATRAIETALAEKTRQLERIALSAPSIIYIFDLTTGRNVHSNSQVTACLGYTPEEIMAMPPGFLLDWLHPDDRERVAASHVRLRTIGEGEVVESEYRLRRKDGAYRWLLSRDVAFRRGPDGTVTQILGAALDITVSKEAQAALAARTAELEGVLATVPAGVWFTYDPEVKRVSRNAFASKLLRLSQEEGKNGTSVTQARPGTLPRVRLFQNGAPLPPDRFPLQRAIRGETVQEEEFAFVFSEGTSTPLLTTAAPLRDAAGAIIGAVSVSLDITERKAAEETRLLLIRELHHRVKNTLATVQAIALITLRSATTFDQFRQTFADRLASLSKTHDLLVASGREAAFFVDLLRGELAPFETGSPDRVRLRGPEVELATSLAVPIGMVVHELTTNAAKYGALSTERGVVDIDWTVEGDGADRCLRLSWIERDGPPVRKPIRTGFGTQLIQRLLTRQLKASVDLRFAAEGLRLAIVVPLRLPSSPDAGG